MTCKCSQISTDFSFQNLVFLWFIYIFSDKNHLKFNISPILNPNFIKYSPLNPTPQDLSNNTKDTSQYFWNVFVMIQFNFQWKNHSIFKNFTTQVQTSWNQANAPLLIESFPKIPRTGLKCPGLLDLIVTKQNKTIYLALEIGVHGVYCELTLV